MKMRRIKFVWGAAKVIKGHWYLGLFGLYDRAEGKHEDGLAISLRGVVLWSAGAVVAAYLAGATALFWFWQRNPYSILTYSDALLRPVRSETVHDKQGQAFITQGTDALRGKRWAEGKNLLERGLALHPNDLRARLVLAQFYVAINQRPAGLQLLQGGLKNEFPGRAYLQVLFDAAEQGEDFGLVERTCERYLPLLKGDAAARDHRWLLTREFVALQGGRQFSAMLALADAGGPIDVTGENRVLALLGLERREEALTFLAGWRKQPRADVPQVLRLTVRTLRELNRFDEMERALEELRGMSPADPRPVVYGVVQRALAGRTEAAGAALENYVFRFGGSVQNLLLVAEPLAETGNLPLLERCVAAASDRGYALQSFRVLLVQTEVQRGDWAAAKRTLAVMKPPAGRDAAQAKIWQDWMQQLVDAASLSNDTAPIGLLEFLRNRPWSINIFRKSIEALRRAGRLDSARDAIGLAERAFPASEWLQTQREDVAREFAAREAAVQAQPVAPVGKLPVERFFFQRLEGALGDANWAEAEQLIRDARSARPPPGWIAARDGELRFAQIQITQAKGAVPEMLVAAKLYLNGDADRAQKVLDLARAIFAKGDKNNAVALAKEVLRISPDVVAAQRLLKEWQPKPPGKTPK